MPTKSREPGVTTEDVAGVLGNPPAAEKAPAAEPAAKPFMSEGIRLDLELNGRSVDPVTGGVWEKDKDTGVITLTDRDGTTHTL